MGKTERNNNETIEGIKEIIMEIIKKYVYAVQRRLPAVGRDDIVKEINSLIYDELEGKFGKKDSYSNEEAEEVLKEMGHPREVAARYRGGSQTFIGPELMPLYKMVLAIAAGGTSVGLLISYIVRVISEAASGTMTLIMLLKDFAGLVGSIFSALLAMVGSVTIIFALIQHFGKFDSKEINIYEDWSPKDLPDLPEAKDRISRAEPIIAMCFIVIGFVFLNYYVAVGNIPFAGNLSSNIVVLPVFSVDALSRYLPFWNLSLGLSFFLQIILLVQGKRTLGTRLFDICISLLGIAILAALINGPMVISLDGLVQEFEYQSWMDSIEKYYYIVLKVMVVLSSIGIVGNIIATVVQQARKANV